MHQKRLSTQFFQQGPGVFQIGCVEAFREPTVNTLEAEEMVREKLWASEDWRRLEIDGGKLFEDGGGTLHE